MAVTSKLHVFLVFAFIRKAVLTEPGEGTNIAHLCFAFIPGIRYSTLLGTHMTQDGVNNGDVTEVAKCLLSFLVETVQTLVSSEVSRFSHCEVLCSRGSQLWSWGPLRMLVFIPITHAITEL